MNPPSLALRPYLNYFFPTLVTGLVCDGLQKCEVVA
jgi:hypothetical protein